MENREERKKEDVAENKELLILLSISMAIVTGGVYLVYSMGFSPTDFIAWVTGHAFIFIFIVAFIVMFLLVAPVSSSLFNGIAFSLLFAVVMATIAWSLSRTPNIPTDEQRYECRITGGQLEYFGERGWVCIKPKP